eukprot:4015431-Pyramimonas_sp.AAC.1
MALIRQRQAFPDSCPAILVGASSSRCAGWRAGERPPAAGWWNRPTARHGVKHRTTRGRGSSIACSQLRPRCRPRCGKSFSQT